MERLAFAGTLALVIACSASDGTSETIAIADPGNLKVSAVVATCPSITAFSASPARAPLGGAIALAGEAADLSRAALSLYWTTTSGVLADANRANTTYQCLAPGAATLTLTASNGVCSDEVSIDVTCGEP